MRKPQSKSPRPKKPKLSDAEQYERFLDAAKKVGASDDPKDFEEAFKMVTTSKKRQPVPRSSE